MRPFLISTILFLAVSGATALDLAHMPDAETFAALAADHVPAAAARQEPLFDGDPMAG